MIYVFWPLFWLKLLGPHAPRKKSKRTMAGPPQWQWSVGEAFFVESDDEAMKSENEDEQAPAFSVDATQLEDDVEVESKGTSVFMRRPASAAQQRTGTAKLLPGTTRQIYAE